MTRLHRAFPGASVVLAGMAVGVALALVPVAPAYAGVARAAPALAGVAGAQVAEVAFGFRFGAPYYPYYPYYSYSPFFFDHGAINPYGPHLRLYPPVRRGVIIAPALGGMLGVVVEPVDMALANAAGLDAPQGVFITEVLPNTAAAGALLPGDIILSMGGTPLNGVKDFVTRVRGTAPGAVVGLEVWRTGASITLEITMGPPVT